MTPKKNIIIIGDSWGIVPTMIYRHGMLSQRHHANNDTSIFQWLDYKLMSLGHNVSNRSWGGSDNFYNIVQAETHLDAAKHHGFNVDLVIWFHAELGKEVWWGNENLENPSGTLKDIRDRGLENALDTIAIDLYTYVRNIANAHPNTKWAILGAGGAVRNSQKQLLNFADLLIDNVRNYMMDVDTPECHTYYCIHDHRDFIDTLANKKIFTEKEKEIELEKWAILDKLGENRKYFHNGKHPSPYAYEKLVNQIIDHFQL